MLETTLKIFLKKNWDMHFMSNILKKENKNVKKFDLWLLIF